ncbi:MAG TPA: sodium-translocating pyrophosphatase [bacterium]|nr:sodium-translocating pyrophosphatase [bacterium]HRT11316.1 sodium-translocating pyrophosphatase [Patescibacteria group bacterium]HPD08087.1 sodium-translocating pyrophosphatase [bacterium]HQE63359.1 sodium-translocating pyrophosphatase [bacterium]HQI94797.1 sodium-translocating pyrophosphatase [bacterium]
MVLAIFWFIPAAGLLALLTAFILFVQMKRKEPGNEKMQKIAGLVRQGAMAYLRQQYKVVAIVFIVASIFFASAAYGFNLMSRYTPFAFLTGGIFSLLCGFIGMVAATHAASRVTKAVQDSLNNGLQLALRSGAILSFSVVGFALVDVSVWFWVLNYFFDGAPEAKMLTITTIMLTFGMGASLQALFARVGGGIFTKAADMGADLVGKNEFGLEEDDPRNPAVIADNVGDNVGDVAGMGADLYESYAGAILASAALMASASHGLSEATQMKYVLLPMVIGALGVIFSVITLLTVKAKNDFGMKQLVGSINKGIWLSSILIAVATFIVTAWLGLQNWLGLSLAVSGGLVVGVVIGFWVNYQTSQGFRPTQRVAESAQTSPATVITSGLELGMKSTWVPVVAVCLGMAGAFYCASGFNFSNVSLGLAGISLAAVGMLANLGFVLATDAFGAIADNAGGNAEMAKLPDGVRKRTDMLDAVGNTTAAIGKGFAIGSAALTAMALLASYIEEVKLALIRAGNTSLQNIPITKINIIDLVNYYQINIMNPKFIIGAFIGAMIVLVFIGLTTGAVSKVARTMVAEVRRQFSNKKILNGLEEPDYQRCIRISTKGAQTAMLTPALLAVVAPIIIGVLLGVAGVMGLLLSAMTTGFGMAVFLANSGGAWDNAKKYVEEGNFGGKGSQAHKAAVIGDMVGDPCKDTSGPALNILIKLMSMVAIVTAGITIIF